MDTTVVFLNNINSCHMYNFINYYGLANHKKQLYIHTNCLCYSFSVLFYKNERCRLNILHDYFHCLLFVYYFFLEFATKVVNRSMILIHIQTGKGEKSTKQKFVVLGRKCQNIVYNNICTKKIYLPASTCLPR